MALTKNQIENVASHYAREYNAWKIRVDLEEILERHEDNALYIFRKLCQYKN